MAEASFFESDRSQLQQAMSRNSWSKSRLFVELTTQQLHQVHTKRGPTENSVHFPAAPPCACRKPRLAHYGSRRAHVTQPLCILLISNVLLALARHNGAQCFCFDTARDANLPLRQFDFHRPQTASRRDTTNLSRLIRRDL